MKTWKDRIFYRSFDEKGYETIITSFGSIRRPKPPLRERIAEILLEGVILLFKVFLILLVILLVVGYLTTCVPAWFQPFINAPLFCVGRR